MTFIEALQAAVAVPSKSDVRVFRRNGPSFSIDEFGQIKGQLDCCYLGDILDLDDWEMMRVERTKLQHRLTP